MTTSRSDAHAPKNFDPQDYEIIDCLDLKQPEYYAGMPVEAYARAVEAWRAAILRHFPDWRTGGTDHQSVHQCNHCGNPHIRWAFVVLHKPTGAKIVVGQDCADRVDLPDRATFAKKFIKDRDALMKAAAENAARKAKFAEDNAEVVAFLEKMEERKTAWREENERLSDEFDAKLTEWYQSGNEGRRPWMPKNSLPSVHPFITDMIHAFNRKGELSEKQVEALRKFMANEEKFEARRQERAAEDAAHAPTGPLVEGRRVVAGEVISAKFKDYYERQVPKMLVREDDGNKVWMTIPEAAFNDPANISEQNPTGIRHIDDFKGHRIEVTATVERSDSDEHFGFGSRPSKPKVAWEEAA
jgi:hypothetical protein